MKGVGLTDLRAQSVLGSNIGVRPVTSLKQRVTMSQQLDESQES